MTAYWAGSPFRAALRLDEINVERDSLGSGGEATGVHRLQPPHQDWVFKRYVKEVPSSVLAGLIAHPKNFAPREIELVNRHTAWPVALVEERPGWSIGAIMPAAPEQYWIARRLSKGRTERRLLDIDLLTRGSDRLQQLGMPGQNLPDRVAVCASIASIAALLERAGLVYLDWSLANVLWSTSDHTCYVIDIDGVTFGPRPQIGSHMFEDPLVPMKTNAGVEVDRYRVALLVAWCLTGAMPDYRRMRDGIAALPAINGQFAEVVTLLTGTLDAPRLSERRPLHRLRDALVAAGIQQSNPAQVQARPDIANGPATITWKPIGSQRPDLVPYDRRTGPTSPTPPWGLPPVQPPIGAQPTRPAAAPAGSTDGGSKTSPVLAFCIVVALILLAIYIISQIVG